MQRRVYTTKLKPERREEYLLAHQQVNPELMRRYRQAGMRSCSVYLLEDMLVLVTEGDDLDRTAAILASDPLDREWQSFVGPMKGEGDYRAMLRIFEADLSSAEGAALEGNVTGPRFQISLAEWSLHRAIQSRLITNLDFPRVAREQFGIEGLEFVNQLWEAPTSDYVRRLRSNMHETGTTGVLIMCDGEGYMGHPEQGTRMEAARNHYKWVDIAAELGCHAIRANMYPGEHQPSTNAEIQDFLNRCAESFDNLCEYASSRNITVTVENHGGVSSDPDVLLELTRKLNRPNFGTLPDFGNFPDQIDKYDAVRKLMPFAKGVSFKCLDFRDGKETAFDMDRMMEIVFDSSYANRWIGIEYGGDRMSEFEGIQAAKAYLEQVL